MSDKKFASQADLEEKTISFDKLSDHAYAYTAEGDPNTGIVIGDDAVMVIDTQATPVMAQDVIRRIREVTSKPISRKKRSASTSCPITPMPTPRKATRTPASSSATTR